MKREDWDARYAGVTNLWSAKPNRFLVSEVGDLEPGRALDIACGEGQNALWLATLGWDVVGVDYSEIAAELPGLEIEKATTVLRDVAGEERDAIDTIVRARRPAS